MGLLDADSEEPRSKLRRYVITGLVLSMLLGTGVWYLFRFHTEKKLVAKFLDRVVAGDTPAAYGMWEAGPSYTYQDFLEDWGPKGEYGPVKSYRIETAQRRKGASGVIVVVQVSPYAPFPSDDNGEKHRHTKELGIWVERGARSLNFPP